jgi:zinc D-Ala-D-Ala carboxypeptidase
VSRSTEPVATSGRPSQVRFWLRRSVLVVVLLALGFGGWKVSQGLIEIGRRAEGIGVDPSPGAQGGPGSPSSPPARALSAPPPCAFGTRPAIDDGYGQWERTLVDTTYRLPSEYAPSDLVSVAEAGFPETGWKVRSLVTADLGSLRRAAAASGHQLDVVAAYRSFQDQADLFQRRVDELGEQEALTRAARPGHSEHQLGTAVDFKTLGTADVGQGWASTPPGAWVEANAWRFGFVESYPKGKQSVTCYSYEPWHYRYVGREQAARIRSSGATARQYLWNEYLEETTAGS